MPDEEEEELVLIYQSTRVVNFAQGEMAMVSTFIAWAWLSVFDYWPAFALTLAVSALLPGTGLLFSLSFARASYEQYLSRWKYIAATLFAAPVLTVAFFSASRSTALSRAAVLVGRT